ncbi:MAG: carbon storage regulator CsrA [Phycisphaerae bacterium]|nr:carbon storage regulator CsrA [Phycisphaerae bacterium]
MLVLSRQRDESIIIGDNVQVTIVDIRGDKVRLGIVAPPEVTVHRKEVYDAIQRENRKASGVSPADLPAVKAASPAAATASRNSTPHSSNGTPAAAPPASGAAS